MENPGYNKLEEELDSIPGLYINDFRTHVEKGKKMSEI